MKPSQTGIEYLSQIFARAIGQDDVETMRDTMFNHSNLLEPYHSLNTDMSKRIRYLASAISNNSEGVEKQTRRLPGVGQARKKGRLSRNALTRRFHDRVSGMARASQTTHESSKRVFEVR